VFKSINLDFVNNQTDVYLSIYNDYNSYRRNKKNVINTINIKIPGIVNDTREYIAQYMQRNLTWFNTATVTTLANLPLVPDTMWYKLSPAPVDSTISRIIGIYSYKDDKLGKQCTLDGWVKHFKYDSLGNNIASVYNQNLTWVLDNTDTVYFKNKPNEGAYDYFKKLQKNLNLTDSMTIIQGIKWADPHYVNDRLKYLHLAK
jgi:hypothetical protein